MESNLPTPLYIIQDSRYVKQDARWKLDDISLCSSGNIAVSGHRSVLRTYKSYVSIYGSTVDNLDSRDKPTLLYHKQFTDESSWLPRCISFIKLNFREIVTCRDKEVQVIDYNRDVVLRSRKVNGDSRCLSVTESQIFIGLDKSNIVNIYDNDLNRIKSIRLKEGILRFWPRDIATAEDGLYVCTEYPGSAIVCSQDSGSKLREGTIMGHYGAGALSIAVNIELGLTAVFWYCRHVQNQIIFYPVSKKESCLSVNVEFGVSRIRISDKGRIVTGNARTGEVKTYDVASLLSYSCLKENLVSRLGRHDCEKLTDFFAMGGEECNTILSSDSPAATLLLALEEKGVIQPSNVERLGKAFLFLEINSSFYNAVNVYQKLRDQINSYDRFLATLSAHLTSSVPEELCDYFHVSDEQKNSIISSQNPGLSLLLVLDETGIITPSEVGCLEEPFNKFRLVQALAKIHEYKEIVEEENRQLPHTPLWSLEDKRALFVEFLNKGIKRWYETMTLVPWKKSCQWKSTDLFVGSDLILTDSKAKQNVQNIDEQCKLNYTEIFTHDKLKSEVRIILEGDPGAGKTILSSQLAYDWSEGKIDGVDILIFLPLKIVEDKTLIQAITEFYIPANTQLSGNDIESILASDTERICLLLDGLEEYSTWGRMKAKESSEVMKIMKEEKYSNCKVIVTSRSGFGHYLRECPLLKLGRFGETQRNSYIQNVFPYDTDKQQKIKRITQNNPFILDLFSVPLTFVLAVHNIESMSLSEESQLSKVSPFMRSMILTLCSSRTLKHEVDGIPSKFLRSEKITLGELAFNGLCKGHQQLSWQKSFMESNVGSLKPWIDSGILVLEEGLVISVKEDEDTFEINTEVKKKVKTKKRERWRRKRTQKHEANAQVKKEKSPEGDSSKNPEKKKKEKDADKSEIVPTEMGVKKILGPSSSHDFPQSPILSKDINIVTASMVASKPGHEVFEIKKQHKSVSEPESGPQLMKKETVRRAAGQVPLLVKFLHKVIQEWFAATFFCSMMRRCTSKDQFQNFVSSQLQHISPTDLHYVLRFTSYLHPPSCHVIMNYLLRSYRKDGCVPPYIMNCVFLCFNEHNDVKESDMRNAVTDVCKEVITIQSEDSRLLQQAKAALLVYASNEGVIIENLELKDVIFTVDKTSLTLNSGVQLGILHTVKVIKVSRWDQVWQKEYYNNILKLLSAGKLLKEVCCIFPSETPDCLDEITLENIVSKDLKVEWQTGHFVQSFDPRKGKWTMSFKQPWTPSTTKIKEFSADQGSAKDEENLQRPTTSSLPSTSAESSKYMHSQGALKQRGSDSITGRTVPEKKAMVVLEEPAVDVTQRVTQAGTISNSEGKDDLNEIPVRNIEGKHFEEEAVAGVYKKRTISEEICVTCVGQGGIRQSVFQEAASVNPVTPMTFPRETLSDATQRTACEDTSLQRAVQEYAPVLGDAPSHLAGTLSVESTISNDGGSLKIAGTGVQLTVPAGAFKEDRSECLIRLRIIPPGHHGEGSTSFCSNSSTIVELLPNNLTLKLPVQVTLPHCLRLKKDTQNKVKIFMSHHEEDAQPKWEEVFKHEYILDDKKCTIWMNSFCWTKYEIDDEIVEAKRITIFTAAKPFYMPDDIAEIQVGYHLDLPGAGEILRKNPSLIVNQRIPYLFLRKGKHPLKVFLSTTSPSTWTYLTPDDNPQEIPFWSVASSLEYMCLFILRHNADTTKVPTCIFVASQNEHELKLQSRPKAVAKHKQFLSSHSKTDIHHEEDVTAQAEENLLVSEQLSELSLEPPFHRSLTTPQETQNEGGCSKVSVRGHQHEGECTTASNLRALQQSHQACLNEFQTHQQVPPYHEYQMLPRSGLPSPVPANPFIQQNYYNQNFSISPYGTPFREGHSLYKLPDNLTDNRGGVGLGYGLIKELGRKLNPLDPLGNNWKELADKLGFTMEDIGVFELAPSPTCDVIVCAMKKGTLKSIEQLKTILEDIGRSDAASILRLPNPKDEG